MTLWASQRQKAEPPPLERHLRAIGRGPLMGAVAEAMRLAHPDHGGDPATAEARLRELKAARAALTELFADRFERSKKPCVQCHGQGRFRQTFGATTCSACEGTGEQTT